ncbi:MAG: hypothetical protein WC568_01115, partial [Candidatus Methanoperedens sp.]
IEEKLQEMDEKDRKKFERIPLGDISFEEIINLIIEKKIDEIEKKIGTYWQFIIDIANTVPVSYLPNAPLNINKKNPILEGIIKDIDRYDFTVEFDGLILKKPMILPNDKSIVDENYDYDVYFINEDIIINDKKLRFRGYFYSQKSQIKPVDFQGVIIRIRNVAIGKADKNFMDYPWAEKMYLTWTFGEIYVDEGLEDALNINRNSFTINHPHYMYLRKYIHDLLHDKIFKRARKRYEEKKIEARVFQEKTRKEQISNILAKSEKLQNIEGIKLTPEIDIPLPVDKTNQQKEPLENVLVETEKPQHNIKDIEKVPDLEIVQLSKIGNKLNQYFNSQQNDFSDPVYISHENNAIIINDRHEIFRKLGKKDREVLEEILVLYKIAEKNSKGNIKKLEELFFENLKEWRR